MYLIYFRLKDKEKKKGNSFSQMSIDHTRGSAQIACSGTYRVQEASEDRTEIESSSPLGVYNIKSQSQLAILMLSPLRPISIDILTEFYGRRS